jgi:hypothetical protein
MTNGFHPPKGTGKSTATKTASKKGDRRENKPAKKK